MQLFDIQYRSILLFHSTYNKLQCNLLFNKSKLFVFILGHYWSKFREFNKLAFSIVGVVDWREPERKFNSDGWPEFSWTHASLAPSIVSATYRRNISQEVHDERAWLTWRRSIQLRRRNIRHHNLYARRTDRDNEKTRKKRGGRERGRSILAVKELSRSRVTARRNLRWKLRKTRWTLYPSGHHPTFSSLAPKSFRFIVEKMYKVVALLVFSIHV